MYSTLTDLTRRGSRLQFAWLAAAALLAAGLLRLVSLPAMNNDMLNAVIPWYTYLAENGRVAAWGDEFYHYTPGYIYLLTAATYLPLPALAAIKVLSISFDLLGACFAYLIVARRTQTGPLPVLAGLLVLLAPTVWVNSAYWGQADMIYTALLLGTVYYALARRPLPAMLAFGLALAIKLQAMFLAPWVLLLVLRGRIPWKTVFVVPLVFFASLLPAAALGRPLGD
ncbi:MAG TPA: glycosyltransferase 87 family protein, partial [Anaerolineaceae bacterium]|nr:glycosyltransferase 87 family protein [Anaerolineaceae bacterium]